MPSNERKKSKTEQVKEAMAQLPSIPKELIDQFVSGPMTGEAVNAASMAFKRALIERAMGAELTHHLGYGPGEAKPAAATNHRNGATAKTVLTDDGPLRIEVPRDRDGSFEPVLIPKHERRFTGFDDKIIALYARGMTVREIRAFLLDSYGVEVSPDFISTVTDAIMAEVGVWQGRALEPMYPVVFFDALRVKIREEKGMPEALAAVFPATTLQTCIVHLIRASLDYASWKERKLLAAALRPIYTAANAEAAEAALDAFEQGMWGRKFPTVVAAWRRAWSHVIPFFAFPPDIRRVIYAPKEVPLGDTTNAIESINARLRKIIKTRGHFPTDDAASKLIWLALRNITADWGRAAHNWKAAMNQFAILYQERFTRTSV